MLFNRSDPPKVVLPNSFWNVGVDYDYIIRAAYLYELNIKVFFVANVTPKVTSMFSREVESQETYGYYIYNSVSNYIHVLLIYMCTPHQFGKVCCLLISRLKKKLAYWIY